MQNIKKSSKGLDENMEAAKSNFLLRGYFKKKEKETEKNEARQTRKEKTFNYYSKSGLDCSRCICCSRCAPRACNSG